MWTPTTRRQHSRIGLRYETDLTDAEWAVLEPLLPEPHRCRRPRAWSWLCPSLVMLVGECGTNLRALPGDAN